jgi:hypothetical protein
MGFPIMFLCKLLLLLASLRFGSLLLCSASSAHPVGSSIMLLGGFGFLGRLHGLSIDNLVEVEMVLADGRIVIINETEYPGKSPVFRRAYTHLIDGFLKQICGGHFEGQVPYLESLHGTKQGHSPSQSFLPVISSSEHPHSYFL